jgi:hypothetical protein
MVNKELCCVKVQIILAENKFIAGQNFNMGIIQEVL